MTGRPPDPDLGHLTQREYEHVYEPAEDSYLLMDALFGDSAALEALRLSRGGEGAFLRCLEVGCGSGTVTAHLFRVLRGRAWCLGTDVNPRAAEAAAETLRRNGVRGAVVLTSFADAVRARGGPFDVVVFNPPYVPTPPEEMLGDGISVSWAGGERGREVLDRLLPQLPALVAPGGLFYLVTVRENDPAEIAAVLARSGFGHAEVAQRRAGPEFLQVHRFTRAVP